MPPGLRGVLPLCAALFLFGLPLVAMAQMGVSTPLPPAERQKAEAERLASGKLADYPQLVDITASTGINSSLT